MIPTSLMLLVAASTSSTLVVEGATTCPTPDAVEARLAELAGGVRGRVVLAGTGRGLEVRFFDGEGALVAERELDGGGTCEALAEAASVVVWAWTLRLPPASSPARESARTPPSMTTRDPADATPTRPPSAGAATSSSTPEAPGTARHAVYAELGGAGVVATVDYEYHFASIVALRVGAGLVPVCGAPSGGFDCGPSPNVVFGAHVLLFEGAHHLEFGIGTNIVLIDDTDARFFVPSVGYRYQDPGGGFLFRVAFTPQMRFNDLGDVLPWGGLSAGYAF